MSEFVATLVAGQGEPLSADFLQKISGQTGAARHAVLDEGRAADLFYADNPSADTLRQSFDGRVLDLFVQPVAGRRKKLLIADMESTIIEQEMLDELADMIGLRDKVAEITRRAMNGELDFAAALRERVALLKGKPAALLAESAQRITWMPGAQALIATMKAHGGQCWLVSGGFTCFVQPVAHQLGFDRSYANELVVQDGMITGDVADPILDKNAKETYLKKACAEGGLLLGSSVAVGDGANDVPMLAACHAGGGLGVAYHAKPNVRAVIPHQVNVGDLTALLYAQGYTREEIRFS